MLDIAIKRVYEPPEKTDGTRVLVDRVWPRGKRKEELHLDGWSKKLAPTPELRKWFGHDPDKWEEFQVRYRYELEQNREAAKDLLQQQQHEKLTLLYGARDETHNHARVLRDYLEGL